MVAEDHLQVIVVVVIVEVVAAVALVVMVSHVTLNIEVCPLVGECDGHLCS